MGPGETAFGLAAEADPFEWSAPVGFGLFDRDLRCRRINRALAGVWPDVGAPETIYRRECHRCMEHRVSVRFEGYLASTTATRSRTRCARCVARECMHLVALSGYAQPEDVQRAAEAGFDEHVAKPADPSEIERLLAT